jgi:uncharacterized protein YgiM (DUF1202 family)
MFDLLKKNIMKRFLFSLVISLVTLNSFAQGVRYTTANLNLRTMPTTSAQVITVIPKGTPVTLDDDCECDWIPVSYNGYIGYVSSKYLSVTKPVVETSTYEYKAPKQTVSSTSSATSNRPIGSVNYYTNSRGQRVQSPTRYNQPPAGATALCRDGTYSFSRNRRGTCSGHGGVAKWLK